MRDQIQSVGSQIPLAARPIAGALRKVNKIIHVDAVINYVDRFPNNIETTIVRPLRNIRTTEGINSKIWFTKGTGGLGDITEDAYSQ